MAVHRDGSSTTSALAMRQVGANPLTGGNYYAAATFTSGRWYFHVTARAPDGTRLSSDFALTIS